MSLDIGKVVDNILSEDSVVVEKVVSAKTIAALGPVLDTLIEGKKRVGELSAARIDEYKKSSTDEEKKLRAKAVQLAQDGEEAINSILMTLSQRVK